MITEVRGSIPLVSTKFDRSDTNVSSRFLLSVVVKTISIPSVLSLRSAALQKPRAAASEALLSPFDKRSQWNTCSS